MNPDKNISLNTVDKDVQSMLLPLDLMQNIMFYPKYRIKNNVITPNSLISKFVSMFATLGFMIAFVHCTYAVMCNHRSLGHTSFMYYNFLYNCIFYCFGISLNFVIELIRTNSNVQFVLKFQKVHRFINNKSSINQMIIWTWIIILQILSVYVIVYTYFYVKIGVPFYSTYAGYILVVFDFNVIYVMRVLRFLENKIVLWNIREFNTREIENAYGENYCNGAFQAYVEIIECYDIFKHNFQAFVSIILLQ